MNNRGMNGNEEEADWSAFKKFWAEEFGGGLQALTMARTSWIAGQKYLHEQRIKRLLAMRPAAVVNVPHGRGSGETPGGSVALLNLWLAAGTKLYHMGTQGEIRDMTPDGVVIDEGAELIARKVLKK